ANIFPNKRCDISNINQFELVIDVLLSDKKTDININRVTRSLFEKYTTPEDYLAVSLEKLQDDIRSIGLYRTKAKNIQKLCTTLLNEFDGDAPDTRQELMQLAEE